MSMNSTPSSNGVTLPPESLLRSGYDDDAMIGVRFYEQVRKAMALVKHEINNPLSIISGNAQLLLEMAKIMELDEDMIRSIRDIEEASQRVATSLEKLEDLKALVASVPQEQHGLPRANGRMPGEDWASTKND